ncbi:MAG: DUF929 family protein [Propionibacteriaceae bacterium]|nr:DUF929 family protein [Propionibacteriaceae bacterium]
MAKSGKPSKAQQESARARLAAERKKAEADARRKKVFGIAAAAVALLLVVVGVIIAIGMNRPGEGAGTGYVNALREVPAETLDAVGYGSLDSSPARAIPGGEVQMEDGKPRILYIGAEYCSYCGFTRWPLTIALERFGDFEGLKPAFAQGRIPTVSYLDSTYTSDYVAFKGYEAMDTQGRPLEEISPEDQAIATEHGMTGYPWLYWGTHTSGTPFGSAFTDGGYMPGIPGDTIAAKMLDTSTPESQAILGAANVTTAQICALTGDQPSDVCTAPGVVAAKQVVR